MTEQPHSAIDAPPTSIAGEDAVGRALQALAEAQADNGTWPSDYAGPMFLAPMYIGTSYILGRLPSLATQEKMIRYFLRHQNEDGGFGLHEDGSSAVFTSVLCYVAMRLLGRSASDPALARARSFFLERGGALGSASWGKFFLCLLNLYDYEGIHPLTPEMWLLPEKLPVHPSRLWCHCRMVYLPMAFLYGKRAQIPADALIREIRSEIYSEPYESIDWRGARERVAATDSYTPHSAFMKTAMQALDRYEKRPSRLLRRRALKMILEHIDYEDKSTKYVCLGPVNKLYNTLCWYFERPGGDELNKHVARLPEYLSEDEQGVRMNGYNSSELWDVTFALQAISASGRGSEVRQTVERAYHYVDVQQVREDPPNRKKYFRDPSRGGWPFSTLDHGWPITDCTSEGVKSALLLADQVRQPIDKQRLDASIELLLYWQNEDGGWATYERMRGPEWLELLNPSDVFGDIMLDYSHVECTSSCMQALRSYLDHGGRGVDRERVERAIERGRDFLLARQRLDGSWEGFWAVCFTYGTWFGVWGLRAAGLPASHPAIQKACDFLERRQLEDGGWGEHPDACKERQYVGLDRGHATQTSWALLALLKGGRIDSESAQRGLGFLRRSQRPDGTWERRLLTGMFNRTCAINYPNYERLFPLWALGLAERMTEAARRGN